MPRAKNPWVKLTRDITFAHGLEKKGTVGIKVGPAYERKDDTNVEIPGMSEVHLVHAKGGNERVQRVIDSRTVTVEQKYRGGDTRLIVAVKDADLELVTDRKDVPAERLATYDPQWQPAAASRK